MATQFDATIVSDRLERGADASVSFPAKDTKVVRKGDGVSREVFGRTSSEDMEYKSLKRSAIATGIAVAGGVLGVPSVVVAGTLGAVCGGVTGLALGTCFTAVPTMGVVCGAFSCVVCSRGRREVYKELFAKNYGCMERCRDKRSKEGTTPELEEVVVEQPKSESPSPEPAPTTPYCHRFYFAHVDEGMRRVLYEQAKASQEKREREKPEEVDRDVQQLLCVEVYPEENVPPVSEARPDRRCKGDPDEVVRDEEPVDEVIGEDEGDRADTLTVGVLKRNEVETFKTVVDQLVRENLN
ncbi:MAG: hypothetical protein OXF02_03435 [Simkaniaceae bacterium]|nr:hypothetical protein [Simkaniaceae bacterium]